MIISDEHIGSREFIIGNYFMTANKWTVDQAAGTKGMNLRGLVVSLDLNVLTSSPTTDPGIAVCIAPTADTASTMAPIGILADDLVIQHAGTKLTGIWVRVQHYGFLDRILTIDAAAVAATDMFMFVNGANGGFVSGCTFSEYTASFRKLSGTLTMDTTLASTVTLLSGVNSTGTTWAGSVGTDATLGTGVSGGAPSKNNMMIGWHPINDPVITPPEIAAGQVTPAAADDYRMVRGFIACLGVQHTW